MPSPVLSLVMPFKNRRDIDFALELAVKIAMRELRRYRIPVLYKSGVRWARDVCKAPGVAGACERFLSPRMVMREKHEGDCDDVVPWRVAELRLGINNHGYKDRKAKAFSVRSPGVGWHIKARHGDGTIEDPSRILGMGKAA